MAIRSFFCQEILKKGRAFPKPYCYGLRRLKTLKRFFGFFKNSSALHACFLLLVREQPRPQKGVIPIARSYNTPHRSRVVKTRMTEEEYADFAARLTPYGISQSEFIRRAIRGASIHPVVTVSPVNDELLAAIGKLTTE